MTFCIYCNQEVDMSTDEKMFQHAMTCQPYLVKAGFVKDIEK